MPLFRKERSYTFSSALTWVSGRHQVRTGVDVVRHELNHIQAEFGGFGGVRGGFQFDGLVTGDARLHPAGLERARRLPARPAHRPPEGRPARRDDGARVAERLLRHRPLARHAKLTLNLGLRFEMYPLMTRADRGIERLDYNTYEVLLGGLGGMPEDVGHQREEVLRRAAARARSTASPRTRCCAPATAARSIRCPGRVRCAGRSRTTSSSTRPRSSSPRSSRSRRASRRAGPRPRLRPGAAARRASSSGRPIPNDVDRATIQQMNVASSSGCRGDISVEVAYVHTRTDGGYADLNINYCEPGGGNAGRKFFALAGTDRRSTTGRRAPRAATTRCRSRSTVRSENGLLLKGAYTLSRSKNETNTTKTAGPASPGTPRLMSTGTSRSPASTARTSSRWASSTSCRSRRTRTACSAGSLQELADQRHRRRVLRHAVLDRRHQPGAQLPGLRRRNSILINVQPAIPSRPARRAPRTEPWYDHGALLAADRRQRGRLRQQPPQPVPPPGGLERGHGLFRSFPVGRLRPSSASRPRTCSTTRPGTRRAWSRIPRPADFVGGTVTNFTANNFMRFTPSSAFVNPRTGVAGRPRPVLNAEAPERNERGIGAPRVERGGGLRGKRPEILMSRGDIPRDKNDGDSRLLRRRPRFILPPTFTPAPPVW